MARAATGAPSTLCEAFQATVALHQEAVALRTWDGEVQVTWREYAQRAARIAAGLEALGVTRGETVALMLKNRPEFHLCDTAALHLGATPFSIYNTSAPEQITHLFTNAANRVVICERQFLDRVLAAREGTSVERVVCIDGQSIRRSPPSVRFRCSSSKAARASSTSKSARVRSRPRMC